MQEKRNLKSLTMTRKLFVLVTAVLISTTSVFAQVGGETGALTWSLEGGVLTITGTGEMPDYGYGGAPWYEYKESISTIDIGSNVTSIGSYAFLQCWYLNSIAIPNSVLNIGNNAFW